MIAAAFFLLGLAFGSGARLEQLGRGVTFIEAFLGGTAIVLLALSWAARAFL